MTARPEYTELLTLLDELIDKGGISPADMQAHQVDTLRHIKGIIEWVDNLKGIFVDTACNDAIVSMLGVRYKMSVCTLVHMEQPPGDRTRVIFSVPTDYAESIRQKLHIPIQPAPMEGTEAMIRAAHSLAGAAIEITHTLKALQEKLR